MQVDASPDTIEALTQFARAQFANKRALVWPAQAAGISRLRGGGSFALCTPTGSGKTTVATLGIIPALFEKNPNAAEGLDGERTGNLVLYLVPSRALAAEVEERLAEDLRGISAQRIVVTGLYGGTDWGPTDAWISQDQPTILICTYEKADALLRFLGVFFLDRVRLVIIDEAHTVNYGRPDPLSLQEATSRAYRLELLGTRLNLARERYAFRTIALSAVAAGSAPSLARWISGDEGATPIESRHRSTRQMLGRLEVSPQGSFTIQYDLMNGQSLKFREGRTTSSPYVGEPFARMPQRLGPRNQPEVRMRAPTLWAALNLAAERSEGTKPTVLVSMAQRIDDFTGACLEILDHWGSDQLPSYFERRTDDTLLAECLASMEDYFSVDSYEYRLLSWGIAVHHGKLPPPVGRRLKRLIDRGTVRVIIATSTLSEGVNIPVNYILIPSVYRGQARFDLQEFSNLIGRAGRPGVATEGHAFVVLSADQGSYRQRRGYEELRDELEQSTGRAEQGTDTADSALLALLSAIESTWRTLSGQTSDAAFTRWLEATAVTTATETPAVRNLDALDYFLLCALREVEELTNSPLDGAELEAELRRIWQATYAHASGSAEARLSRIWFSRGRALPRIYPDSQERARIYRTSLTPRSATILLEQAPSIVDQLKEGLEYARWTTEQRFGFVARVIGSLNEVPAFRLSTRLGGRRNFTDWQRLLRWWMCKETLDEQPTPKQITVWFDYVSKNFCYLSTWGLGGLISVAFGDNEQAPIRPLEIGDWPLADLPWIAFWLKELLTWGTLEPVAAFLLARGYAKTRTDAEVMSQSYYSSRATGIAANDLLDPRAIRDWAQETGSRDPEQPGQPHFDWHVTLTRNRNDYLSGELYVTPVELRGGWTWVDKAGYAVANSAAFEELRSVLHYEFTLDVPRRRVRGRMYLPHRE